jgi:putative ABC transport system permease protein
MVLLLSKDFAKLVAMAFIVAAPLSYFLTAEWLQNFAYRVRIGAWIFISVGLLALMIAFVTVSYHAGKAALTNPVKVLRYE